MLTSSTKNNYNPHCRRLGMCFLFILYMNNLRFFLCPTCRKFILCSIFQALSYLSLAAACSTASTTMFLHDAGRSYCPAKLCTRYQLSAAMAFLSWFLSMGSCLFNLWLFPSL
ncbi:hypothetical protein ABKV19_007263 [Rosa sericea]